MMKKSASILLFGSTGDLTKRKLVPALYRLYERGIIDGTTPIIGIGRRKIDTPQFIDHLDADTFIPPSERNERLFRRFLNGVRYVRVDMDSGDFSAFRKEIVSIEKAHGAPRDRMFYLATPSELFEQVIHVLHHSGLIENVENHRVVFEKPFGHDLRSSETLHNAVSSVFNERQIYRIDHYLGKELVRNIFVIRFGNPFLSEVWNGSFIDHVQITVAETMGVAGRGGYYDKAGVLQDMVQNHLLQVLSLIAMEEPQSLEAGSLRIEKQNILQSLREPKPEDIVLGQYDAGTVDNSECPGYRQEEGVYPGSVTETFAALRMFIDNERWRGVPFYVRTGKRLAAGYSEVNLFLKNKTCKLFHHRSGERRANIITIRIKPDEGLMLRFNVKKPGAELTIHPATLSFCHHCEFGGNTPEAYEMLLDQVLEGDRTLFISWGEIEASWKYIDRVMEIASEKRKQFPNYPAGSFGPPEAEELLSRDGRRWLDPNNRDVYMDAPEACAD